MEKTAKRGAHYSYCSPDIIKEDKTDQTFSRHVAIEKCIQNINADGKKRLRRPVSRRKNNVKRDLKRNII
jgi:hypothetical protein